MVDIDTVVGGDPYLVVCHLENIPGIEGAVLLPGKNISANTCLYIDLFDSVIACTYQ